MEPQRFEMSQQEFSKIISKGSNFASFSFACFLNGVNSEKKEFAP